jgi:hypothetical protein
VKTGEFAGSTIEEQARQALRNCQAILRAVGPEDAAGLGDVSHELFPMFDHRAASASRVDRPGLLVSMQWLSLTTEVIRMSYRGLWISSPVARGWHPTGGFADPAGDFGVDQLVGTTLA